MTQTSHTNHWPMDAVSPDLNILIRNSDLEASVAMADSINERIRKAWIDKNFHIKGNQLPDVSIFSQLSPVEYEFMEARIAPGAVENGIGVLQIIFPAGCSEADKVHTHPGGRVLIVEEGHGTFHFIENGQEQTVVIEEGDIVMMPPCMVHNFAAAKEVSMKVISAHIGYKDVESEEAITWIES